MDIQPNPGTGTNIDERQYEEITPPTTSVNFEIDDPARHKQSVPAAAQQQQQPAAADLTSTSTVSTSSMKFVIPLLSHSKCV